jgi:Tfp pilus assembly protein PilO
MQKHRILSLASILAMLLIPALAFLLVAQPQLEAAASADQQRADTEAQIVASAAIVAQLKADSAKLPQLNADLNDLRTSIPFGVDSSGYIDGLDALAKIAKVTVKGLTVGDAQAYAPAVPPVDPNAAAPDASAEGAEGGEPQAVPPVDPNPAIVTSPLIDSTNFVAVPVTVDVEGGWAGVLKFVQGVQSSPRLFLVTKLDTKTDEGGDVEASVGGYIYAIPTGVEGKPRPISTTVKSMEPAAPETEDETDGATDGTTDEDGETDPDPGQTPAP